MLKPNETFLDKGWFPKATSGSLPLKSLLLIWNGLDREKEKPKFLNE